MMPTATRSRKAISAPTESPSPIGSAASPPYVGNTGHTARRWKRATSAPMVGAWKTRIAASQWCAGKTTGPGIRSRSATSVPTCAQRPLAATARRACAGSTISTAAKSGRRCTIRTSSPSGAAGTELDPPHVGRVNLHGHRLADQRHGKHDTVGAVLSDQEPSRPFQRAADHLDLIAFLQEGMWIVAQPALEERADGFDLVCRDRLRSIGEPDHGDHAERLQHRKPICVAKTRETVAGEQRHLDLLRAVAPPAEAPVERQEWLHAGARFELVADAFLVPGTRVQRVPARLGDELAVEWLDGDQPFHFSRSALNVVPCFVVV